MSVYVVLVGLGIAGLLYGLIDLRRALDSGHWRLQEAEVLDSAVKEHRGGKSGTTYSPSIHYAYRYEGIAHEGTRIMFSGLSLTSSRADAEQFLVPFAKGARILVRISPRDPRVSVIEPGVDRRLKVMIFVSSYLVFMGVGGFLGWWK